MQNQAAEDLLLLSTSEDEGTKKNDPDRLAESGFRRSCPDLVRVGDPPASTPPAVGLKAFFGSHSKKMTGEEREEEDDLKEMQKRPKSAKVAPS